MKAVYLLIFIITVVTLVRAQVFITEIMYDVVGTDTGREWIEIYNNGNDTVSLTNWKLWEQNTNHALLLSQGSLQLSPRSWAIIADTPSLFIADYPTFNGTLLDSVFSLSNTGEELGLSNGTELVDDLNYSNFWGGGNGSSLELQNLSLENNVASSWKNSSQNGTPGYFITTCIPSISRAEFTPWTNATNVVCTINDTRLEKRTAVQYDANFCGTVQNNTITEIRTGSCDACVPNWIPTSICIPYDTLVYRYNDSNACYLQTNLTGDLLGQPENVTLFRGCDSDSDGFLGNSSNINSSVSLELERINNSVLLKSGNALLVEFNYSFLSPLDLSRLWLEASLPGEQSSLSFRNFPTNKTVYLTFANTSSNAVCIKDAEITSISELSNDCSGADETIVLCDGIRQNGFLCALENNRTRIEGLQHSAVRETYYATSSDSGAGSSSSGSSSGGGGSSGGSTLIRHNVTQNTDNQSVITPGINSTQSSIPINQETAILSEKNLPAARSSNPTKVVEKEIQLSQLSFHPTNTQQEINGQQVPRSITGAVVAPQNDWHGSMGIVVILGLALLIGGSSYVYQRLKDQQ